MVIRLAIESAFFSSIFSVKLIRPSPILPKNSFTFSPVLGLILSAAATSLLNPLERISKFLPNILSSPALPPSVPILASIDISKEVCFLSSCPTSTVIVVFNDVNKLID